MPCQCQECTVARRIAMIADLVEDFVARDLALLALTLCPDARRNAPPANEGYADPWKPEDLSVN